MAQSGVEHIHWYQELQGAQPRDQLDRRLRPLARVQPGVIHPRLPELVAVRLFRPGDRLHIKRLAAGCGYEYVEEGERDTPIGQLGGMGHRQPVLPGVYP
jgi:hypothetical protein